MSDVVLKVEGLYKQYRIGVIGASTLRDEISWMWDRIRYGNLKNNVDGKSSSNQDLVWVLQDLNFEIKQGEAVGIIGKNGAGKSTLLKILSKVTAPTKGEVKLKGRISSLLEVGTGFHPELTGRENIFLNGAILGMTRSEVSKKLDSIIDFSGVEKYIDTPVKRYSSGMYVRLAFAVAAHLEPDILIIDEVLAVGDAEFQKKCLGKMNEVTGQGRTVLFVSHNMDAVTRLCKSAVLLKSGKIEIQGSTSEVVNHYLKSDTGTSAIRKWKDLKTAPGNDIVSLMEVKVIAEDGSVLENVDIRKTVGICLTYHVHQQDTVFTPGINLHNDMGIHVLSSHDIESSKSRRSFTIGIHSSTVWFPGNFFAEGRMIASIAIMKYDPFEVVLYESDAVAFNVVDTSEGDSARGIYGGNFPGVIRPILKWD